MKVLRLLQDQSAAATETSSSTFPASSPSSSTLPSAASPSTSSTRRGVGEVKNSPSPSSSTLNSAHDSEHLENAPDDQPFDVLRTAAYSTTNRRDPIPEQGFDLVGGTLLVNGYSFTARMRLRGGLTATSSILTTALLGTVSQALFITSDYVADSMITGAACVCHSTSRGWGGFGDDPVLETTKFTRRMVNSSMAPPP